MTFILHIFTRQRTTVCCISRQSSPLNLILLSLILLSSFYTECILNNNVNFKFTECTRIIIPPKHSAFSWYDLKWFKCMWTLVHRNARGVLYLLNTVHFNILLNTITVWCYLQLTLVSYVLHSMHSQLFAGSVSQSLDSSSKHKRVIGRLIVSFERDHLDPHTRFRYD